MKYWRNWWHRLEFIYFIVDLHLIHFSCHWGLSHCPHCQDKKVCCIFQPAFGCCACQTLVEIVLKLKFVWRQKFVWQCTHCIQCKRSRQRLYMGGCVTNVLHVRRSNDGSCWSVWWPSCWSVWKESVGLKQECSSQANAGRNIKQKCLCILICSCLKIDLASQILLCHRL